jgi:hypothetical protein
MISVLYLSKNELELQFVNIGKAADIIVCDYNDYQYKVIKNRFGNHLTGIIDKRSLGNWLSWNID